MTTELKSFPSKAPILIIDDDPNTTDCYQELLEEKGIQVRVAANQWDAFALLDNLPELSLILVDYSLPGLEGREFVAAIRAKYINLDSRVPIVIFSGHSGSSPLAQGIRSAGGTYIEKPYDIYKFLEIVLNLIS